MRNASHVAVAVLLAAFALNAGMRAQSPAAGAGGVPCASLTTLTMANVRVTEAAAAAPAGAIRVAHCRVSGVIDKETRFTALLPETWNGRLFAGGGGGFVGSVQNQAQASVNTGYATIGTDTGHQGGTTDATWALNNPERLANFGHLAIHRTAETAKALIKAHYGREASYSYFYGCSNGGRQALMEVQRYPADFDGVVSCAPAFNFTNVLTSFLRNTQTVFPNPANLRDSVVSTDSLKLLEAKVLEACDSQDGVKDGVLDDPRSCGFKIADLPACANDQAGAGCVTNAQRAALERIHSPATASGETIYPGQPFGGEGQNGGWQTWITGVSGLPANAPPREPSLHYGFSVNAFKFMVFGRSDWDYSTYDLKMWKQDTKATAAIINADNPDISAFKARRGKLILGHGWADPALNPLATIEYYGQLEQRDRNVRDYARLFLMPGVLHCGGGTGPDTVDWYTAIADWVERGVAPERIIAQKLQAGQVTNSRPLCAYPQRAVYDGKGTTTDATSYACRAR